MRCHVCFDQIYCWFASIRRLQGEYASGAFTRIWWVKIDWTLPIGDTVENQLESRRKTLFSHQRNSIYVWWVVIRWDCSIYWYIYANKHTNVFRILQYCRMEWNEMYEVIVKIIAVAFLPLQAPQAATLEVSMSSVTMEWKHVALFHTKWIQYLLYLHTLSLKQLTGASNSDASCFLSAQFYPENERYHIDGLIDIIVASLILSMLMGAMLAWMLLFSVKESRHREESSVRWCTACSTPYASPGTYLSYVHTVSAAFSISSFANVSHR